MQLLPLSPRLQHLVSNLESNPTRAEADFWQTIPSNPATIIEPLNADECSVTWIVRHDEQFVAVAYIQDWGTDGIIEHSFQRLAHTDVWYYTRILPADTRTAYQIARSRGNDVYDIADYVIAPQTTLGYLGDQDEQDIVFSLLELPNAPLQPWKDAAVPRGDVHEERWAERRIWIYTPAHTVENMPLLVIVDGRLYNDQLLVPQMLNHLIANQRMPPSYAVFVDTPDRWNVLACNAVFTQQIAHDLVPLLRQRYTISPHATDITAIGSSLGGLWALYAAHQHPTVFGKVLSQTGWFRWHPDDDHEHEWLARQIATSPLQPIQIYCDVGTMETARFLDGGVNQLTANRHMRTVLQAKGYDVTYHEYHGGHDFASLESSLYEAIAMLVKR